MALSVLKQLLIALALPSAMAMEAAAQQATQQAATAAAGRAQYHVVELFNSDTTTLEQVLSAFAKLGASKEKVMPLIEDIDKNGKAVVVAGTKESCEEAAEYFHEIGMKTEVRLLTKDDIPKREAQPSEYDDSDVVVADADKLNEMLESGDGLLINFYAPWCGHCKTLVPDYKEAATTLRETGVRLVAMDGQAHPGIARQLGVRGYPALKWLKLEGDSLVMADYQGGRDAASIVRFAQAASKAGALRSKLPQGSTTEAGTAQAGSTAAATSTEKVEQSTTTPAPADGETNAAVAKPEDGATKSKLGNSKLAGSKVASADDSAGEAEAKPLGVQKAKMPAEAEATMPQAAAAASGK